MHINYKQIVDRNIGLLTEEEQEIIRKTHVVVFGIGGLGGVIAEILVRSGITRITVVDKDVFDPTNLNRQIFAYTDTIGMPKIDVAEEFLRRINPELTVVKASEVSQQNIQELLQGVSVALLALDDISGCIIISRNARQMNIPLVEGWAIPYGNVRVYTTKTPSLEEVYNLPTSGKDINSLTMEERQLLNLKMLYELRSLEGINEYYPDLALKRINQGTITSFAPMVWLTAVLMANEALKIILNKGKIAYAPLYHLYDPYKNTIPKQHCNEDN
jgi:molybdopterin/thiamine biosynthesis adenylyltransferase